jgi:hypothetical protein
MNVHPVGQGVIAEALWAEPRGESKIAPLKLSAKVKAAARRALKKDRCFANIISPSDGFVSGSK